MNGPSAQQQAPQTAHAAPKRPRPYRLRAVLFDFDGTLTYPGALDFEAMRRKVDCPADRFVLEFVESLPDQAARDTARSALELFELEAAAQSRPNQGAEATLQKLRDAGLSLGVLTRNGLASIIRAFGQFPSMHADWFDVIVTRDDGVPNKPAPDGVLHACNAMGVSPHETLVVGDFLFDVEAGNAAGAMTAFLTNGGDAALEDESAAWPGNAVSDEISAMQERAAREADVVVHTLAELEAVIGLGLPLPAGKLPNELLARHLQSIGTGDGDVIVGAGVGDDVAALDVREAEVITLHSDPITLTTGDVGRYSVLVNANDIATAGAVPRWLLTAVLLPLGTTGSQALAFLGGVADAAAAEDIALIGGHTEITDAVTRPVMSSTMLGAVRRADLRDKRDAHTGDEVLLTKALAVEGTALLAGELHDRLLDLGMSAAELGECERLLDRVSIVPEARIASGFASVRALHDVTEGGLATALRELATATGHRVTVVRERIPVLPETRRVCDLLEADPLGLIGSGSLLICCRPDDSPALLAALQAAHIPATAIGSLGETGSGVAALLHGQPAPWPSFAADEAARLVTRAKPESKAKERQASARRDVEHSSRR
jgi:hydrogenase expression/formation protein HypE